MADTGLSPHQTNISSIKLLKILELLASQAAPLGLYEIAAQCGMNQSTALRFLMSLVRTGYAAQNEKTGKYHVTFKICALAENVKSYSNVRNLAYPYMEKAAAAFQETCNLSVLENYSLVYIAQAVGTGKILMSTQRIGHVAPLYCTGAGKLMLMELPEAEIKEYLDRARPVRYTEQTVTEFEPLMRELEEARRRGCAFDNEECETGVRCVAAPIRDYSGKITTAVSVSGPVVRMTDAHIARHLPCLLEAAGEISRLLGFSGESWKER